MAYAGTGPITKASLGTRQTQGAVYTYHYSSDQKTTSDNYADTELAFGTGDLEGIKLQEVFIINTGANPLAFQWLDQKGSGKDCGMVPANDKIVFRRAWKSGISLRSFTSGASTSAVVFGV